MLEMGPTAEHMDWFCYQPQLWPRRDLETLPMAACAKKATQHTPSPWTSHHLNNFCIFVFNAHLFKVAKEIVHEPFQSNKGQKYKGYKSKPTGRVSQRVTWYSGPHRNSSKQWSDTVVHTCNPSYSACRGRRIGWDWATKQNPIY